MCNYTENELKAIIEKDYGFKFDLIKNPRLCGLWYLRFEVNGIKYYGRTPYHGALPMLQVEGYTANHYYKGTPLTEEYYKKHIHGKKLRLLKLIDTETGYYEDTGKRFATEEDVQTHIKQQKNPANWDYDLELNPANWDYNLEF